MLPADFHDFFVASAGATAALIGLLFVAISVSPDKLASKETGVYAEIHAATALLCFTDVLAVSEPRALDLVAQLYHLPQPPTEPEYRALAEPWRPFRTWTTVLIRAASSRILT